MDKIIDNIKKGISVALSEAGKFTKTVAGKTNNIVDVTKLNLTLSDTERKIAALEEKIGEMVYIKYSEGSLSSNDFKDLCKEIDAFKAEQKSIKAQIAELKNSISCPKCGAANDTGSEFCSKCGVNLSSKGEEHSKDNVIEVTELDEE